MRSAFIVSALLLTACGGGSNPGPGQVPTPQPPAPAPSPPPPPSGTILVGDELIADWQDTAPASYPAGAISAGVSGATATELAARFQADVLDRNPAVVVVSGGLHDLRTQHTLDDVGTILNMADRAAAAGACVVLVDILPVNQPPSVFPSPIPLYNDGREAWAAGAGYRYVAAFGPLATAGKLSAAYDSGDGWHINAAGYAILGPLVAAAIAACN